MIDQNGRIAILASASTKSHYFHWIPSFAGLISPFKPELCRGLPDPGVFESESGAR
jgi:glycerol kinase